MERRKCWLPAYLSLPHNVFKKLRDSVVKCSSFSVQVNFFFSSYFYTPGERGEAGRGVQPVRPSVCGQNIGNFVLQTPPTVFLLRN